MEIFILRTAIQKRDIVYDLLENVFHHMNAYIFASQLIKQYSLLPFLIFIYITAILYLFLNNNSHWNVIVVKNIAYTYKIAK